MDRWHDADDRFRDERGFARTVKNYIPESAYRAAVRSYNGLAARVPALTKYRLGARLRRRHVPYSVLSEGDVAVQVGAPRDILLAGRSRSIHFALRVGPSGRVIVIEPDPANVAALREFVRTNGLDWVSVAAVGAWSSSGTLEFLASPTHPASNVLAGVKDLASEDTSYRNYERIEIQVDTIDNLLRHIHPAKIRLVSITTNGAELAILEGMSEIMHAGAPYISLAKTGTSYVEAMASRGYACLANDDRGFFFARGLGG